MTYVQINKESFDLLAIFKSKYPHYECLFENIEKGLNFRLWHQLSDDLIELTNKTDLQQSRDLIDLYNQLIMSLEMVFNPLKLMILVQNVVKNFDYNLNDALIFLDNIETRLEKKGEELLFMKTLKGFCHLKLNNMIECEGIIKNLKIELEKMFEVDQIIYSNFYRLSAIFYEIKKNFDEFYSSCLQYLAYVKDTQISHVEKINLCYKMCLSSLVGEKMFNTSEFIEKDFFKKMSNSQFDWIYKLILSFNSAKVDQFEEMLRIYNDNINNEEILRNNYSLIKVKIRIAALLDLIFQKNKNERVLSFKEVSQVCCCSMNDVEILLIKAMSLGLIRGHIDEVENKFIVNWIQPKYLDNEKITILHDRISNWIQKSEKVLVYFQDIAGPLLV